MSRKTRDVLSVDWVRLELLRTAYSTRGGLFARMDPRMVIAWYLVMAIAPWFTHNLTVLIGFFALGVVSVILARVGPLVLGLFVIGLGADVIALFVAAFLFGGDLTTLTLPLAGLMWGLGDALATATMSILPVKVMGRYGNFTVNGLMFLISGVILCAVVRPWAHAPQLDALGIGLMVFTVIGGTFGAYWLYMSGVMRIGAMRATMLGTSEPVLATISAVALTGAVFTPVDLVGFAMILAMVFLVR